MGDYIIQDKKAEDSFDERQFLKKQKENEFRLKSLKKNKEEIEQVSLKKYYNYKPWIIAGIVVLFLLMLGLILLF